MKIIIDISLEHFIAWSGAVDTKNRIVAEGLENEFESLFDEYFPEGATNTDLNDWLWSDEGTIFDALGITGEEEETEEDQDEE